MTRTPQPRPQGSKFATSVDGIRIAYRVYGKGSPTIILSNGLGCNQVMLDYLIQQLCKHYQTIIWDYRGHIDSEAPLDSRQLTINCCMWDMLAVMEIAQIHQAIFGGFSMGVQMSLEFYSRYPQRVLGLLAMFGTYQYPLRTFFHLGSLAHSLFPLILSTVQHHHETIQKIWTAGMTASWTFPLAKHLVFNPQAIKREDFDRYIPHLAHIDVRSFFLLGEALRKHSASGVLSKVEVPTLILAGDRDNFTPVAEAQKMHHRIPRSEWSLIPGGSHGALMEFPDLISAQVLEFIKRNFG